MHSDNNEQCGLRLTNRKEVVTGGGILCGFQVHSAGVVDFERRFVLEAVLIASANVPAGAHQG